MEARRLLLDLWKRSQTYDVAVTLGQTEYQLEHHGAAARYLDFAIQHFPPAEKPETLEDLKSSLAELKKVVGTVRVTVNQPSAEIIVDKNVVGRSPFEDAIYLDMGPHTIEARLGNQVATHQLDAFGGKEYPVTLTLNAAAPAPEQPSAPPPVDSGTKSAGPTRNYTPAVVAISAGGAALIGGTVFFVVASSKDSRREDLSRGLGGENPCGSRSDLPAECEEIADLADGATTFRTLSYVSFGTALAAGVVTYFVWPRSGTASGTGFAVAPTFSADAGSLQLGASGRF